MSGRMKITKSNNFNRNKNVIVVGGAGSGKTRFYVKPNFDATAFLLCRQ